MSNIPAAAWSRPWLEDESTTLHQSALSQRDLTEWFKGTPHVAFDALSALLKPIAKSCESFLEVGCGCGYNSAVVLSIIKYGYTGLDLSPRMVKQARETFPLVHFRVGSADKLPFAASNYSIVCLAAVIQHLPDYKPAIREAVRVSSRYVILHRVELTTGPTYEFKHAAYDTELPTRKINEAELLEFCMECGLKTVVKEEWGVGETLSNASFLMEKE